VPDTYKFTGADGVERTFQGDRPPSVDEMAAIARAEAKPDFTTTNLPLPDVSAHAGVPARGRGTQLDLDKSNRGAAFMTTPLARPTGVDAIDSFTSPVGLASLAAGGVGIARAGMTGGAMAAAKVAAADASPLIKYEIAAAAMEHVGVPSAVARPIAMVLAGYKKGAKAEADVAGHVSAPGYPREVATPAPAAAAAAPHLDLSRPMPAGTLTSEQIGERIAAAQAQGYTPPPVATKPPLGARMPAAAAPVPVPAAAVDEFTAARAARQASPPAEANLKPGRPGGNPALPDQVALNAEAIARRRAAYVASQQGAPAVQPIVKASGQMKLTAPEFKEFQRLTQQGMPPAAAAQEVKVMRDLAQQFGLATPTAAETRFPKAK